MVAGMLLDKTVTFRSTHDTARMKDPEVLRERAKVQLIKDDELQNLMPLRVAVVDIKLADGKRLTKRVDNVRGTPQNPMTREEVLAKAKDLITPVMGVAGGTKLVGRVMEFGSGKKILRMRALLQNTKFSAVRRGTPA